jgi:hypothetical protein
MVVKSSGEGIASNTRLEVDLADLSRFMDAALSACLSTQVGQTEE